MPPNDSNKLNRIEELKSKLFSKNYQTKIEHRDGFSQTHMSDVQDEWGVREKPEENMAEQFFKKTSRFKKFFIFSLSFFALTLLYAGYVFLAGGNAVSNENIDISILGNNFTAGGEELSLIVGITNKNSSALDLVDLVVQYPKGSSVDQSFETEYFRQSLGTIPAGTIRNENLKLVLFGEQGSIRPIKITMEYRVAGSNAIFIKEKVFEVTINSTPINLRIDAPTSISPNQEITLKVQATLNATRPSPGVLIKADYPAGFSFIESTPAPSLGNNIWNLGDLAPGAQQEILISGKMIDVFDGEEKTFNVSTGSQSGADKSIIGVVFNSIRHTIAIKKAFVEANLFINGVSQREYSTDSKTAVTAEIRYSNNLDTKIDDLKIEAKLSGNAFNENSMLVQQGFYDSSKDLITWDRNSKNQLRALNPGDSGYVTFSVSPTSLFSTDGVLLSNPSINIEVNISGKQDIEGFAINELKNSTSAIVRIISDIGFLPKILHYTGPFANSGPIPPKAEEDTTYTVVWTLTNTSNSISNTEITSSLPSWVSFVGPISPPGENLTYNASTKKITWKVNRIPKGAGIIQDSRSAAFQISFQPSLSQVGTTPILTNEALLTGYDDFAKVDVRVSKGGLTSKVEDEAAFPKDGGTVAN